MIVYFTGTGNSRRAARILAGELNDELFSINDLMISGGELPTTAERYVFCAPTYAWRMPRCASDIIARAKFDGRDAWFVLTCGASAGMAGIYLKKLCARVGLRYKGLAEVIMRENYIAMFSVPDADESERIHARADAALKEIADKIARGETLSSKRSPIGYIESALVNPAFYRFSVSDAKFRVAETCIGCGACAGVCPLKNIDIVNDKPAWNGNCTHCMGCISVCPRAAIEYGKKSVGKPRIYLP